MNKVLERLDSTIQKRIKGSSKNSHTAKLVKKGPEKCAEKFGEEAIELIVASIKKKKKEVISEAADTLYHLCVLLGHTSAPKGPFETTTERDSSSGPSGLFKPT